MTLCGGIDQGNSLARSVILVSPIRSMVLMSHSMGFMSLAWQQAKKE
jgi:hypothetical protein